MHDGMNGFTGMGFGWIWWFLIIIAMIVLIIFLFRRGGNRNTTPPASGQHKERESAMDVLEKRYANGEINTEEYRQRKRELSS